MLEVELKSVVDDTAVRRAAIERAGGVLVFEGRLEDRRYDFDDRSLTMRDHVLRVRIYRDASPSRSIATSRNTSSMVPWCDSNTIRAWMTWWK